MQAKPHRPEPIEKLKIRFQAAIIDSYDAKKILDNKSLRPGDKPQHIFDCEDGIRLIISKDRVDGKEYIHFSASVEPLIYRGPIDTSLLIKMQERFMEISSISTQPTLVAFSLAGIPHWIIEVSSLN